MTAIRCVGVLVSAVLLAFAAPVRAGDEARADCRRGCEEAMRSCRAACRPERDSGTGEASERYVECDAACHDDYAACTADCAAQ